MAETNLREYLARLDTLLDKRAQDEVIHHCRHILQYFPKNVAAYRYLGRALVYSGSWQEAAEVFRRVLSVLPDDYTAHVGLSEVYLNIKRSDDAIWHLERAYEQDPNNRTILDSLRELYRKFRRVEYAKVQLTAGAVARQYIRNGLYEQAIDVLRSALARASERIDLQVLLAQSFRDSGRMIEAGETAIDILRVLPDCLDANRILAELWLSQQRPSDAQRYISRVESLDPYLALELARGQPAPDDAFRLEELDYGRTAQREIISRAPDWLQQIDQGVEQPLARAESRSQPVEKEESFSDWMVSFKEEHRPRSAVPAAQFDELFSTELPEDWFSGTPDIPEDLDAPPPSVALPRKRTGLTGLLSALNAPEPEPQPAAAEMDVPANLAVEENLFPEFEQSGSVPDAAVEADLFDFPEMEALAPEPAAPQPERGGSDADDPLAWLHQSGIEVVEEVEPSPADLFEDDELILQDADAVNPLAWLQEYGGEHIIEPAVEEVAQQPVERFAEDEFDLTDEAAADMRAPDAVRAEAAVREEDSLDWLADESLLDEALNLEALIEAGGNAPAISDSASDFDMAENLERRDKMSSENDFDWLSKPDSTPEHDVELPGPADSSPLPEDEAPEWLSQAGSVSPVSSEDSAPDLFADLEDDAGQNWVSAEERDVPSRAAAPTASGSDYDAGEFEWMDASVETKDSEPQPAASGMLDWLSEMQPSGGQAEEQPSASTGSEFEWMSEAEPEAAEAALADEAAAGAMPDWLSAMQPSAEAEAALAEAETEAAGGMEFEWMSEAEPEAAEAALADEAVAGEMPDWLSAMQPSAEAPETEADAAQIEWTDEDAVEEEPAAEMPDWLSRVRPAAVEAGAAEESGASDFNWQDELVQSTVLADEGAPDWLISLQTPDEEPESVPEAVSEPGWIDDVNAPGSEEAVELEPALDLADEPSEMLSEESAAALIEEEFVVAPASNAPDWLNAMVPGLDMDFGVGEDAADGVAQAPAVEQPGARSTKSYDWLIDMVDEETREGAAVAPPAAGRSRFAFSRQPAWLRAPTEERDQPQVQAKVEQADDQDSFGEPDLPPWLR